MSLLKNPWIIITLIAVVLIGGAMWFSGKAAATYNEGVVISAHVKGDVTAPVSLIEYSDFQCPACSQFHPVVEEILEEYGDRIAFEYRHFPLTQIHPLAEPAARAAEAAGQQGKFFEFHDLLFVNQGTWSTGSNASKYFVEYATALGLDIDKFMKQQRSSVLRDHVRAQFDEARKLGFTGTPSFVLNGKKMEFNTFDDFKAQIAAAVDPMAAGADVVLPSTVPVVTSTAPTTTIEATTPSVRFGI
jgi:protein-disulfide isomerase